MSDEVHPTSMKRLAPFIKKSSLVILVEHGDAELEDGWAPAIVFRATPDGEFIEQPSHTVQLDFWHEPYRHIRGVKITKIAPPEPVDRERGAA